MRFIVVWILISLLGRICPAEEISRLFALCYHDIPLKVQGDRYAVDLRSFVQQVEYLSNHGWRFVSLQDVIDASRGTSPLPAKAVLLTFDDGYASHYQNLLPVLTAYKIPAVWAVVTSWIDHPPAKKAVERKLLTWENMREAARTGLVEIASHSHDHHRSVRIDPQGTQSPAAISRRYNSVTKRYETTEAYRRRLYTDFRASYLKLKAKLNTAPRAMVWPYGKYNAIAVEEVKRAGFEVMLTLDDGSVRLDALDNIPRFILLDNPPLKTFIAAVKRKFSELPVERIIHVDVDQIHDPDPAVQENNIARFVARMRRIRPSSVYLQAFCEKAGTGNATAMYFPNRILPTTANLLGRLVQRLHQLEIRAVAWMPVLSIVLPDGTRTDGLRVREFRGGVKRPSTASYRRLSPFSSEARRVLTDLYSDLAMSADIDGILLQDDAYLNDFEDFHPEAADAYRRIAGDDERPFHQLTPDQKVTWTRLKTKTLISLTDELLNAVRRHRPRATSARTLYALVLTDPQSEEWFAQNYAESLKAYDRVVIMAYPRMEEVEDEPAWLRSLVHAVKRHSTGIAKTVFKVQTYDWKRKRWIPTEEVKRWLEILVAAGARHIAYYPDSYLDDRPRESEIREVISTEPFPFGDR